MTNKKQQNFEHFLYLLIFGAALFVRLLLLGKAPLGEFEAKWAYQAWELAQGQTDHVGVQAGYLTLTENLFSLFESTNALARFWPAFLGSLIIFFPFFFRDQLGKKAAIIMALGLALDPGLVATSRLAGGPMLALAFSLLAIGVYFIKKPVWAVFFGGLALFSGTSLWMGALGLVITFGVSYLLGIFDLASHVRARFSSSPPGLAGERSFPWRFVTALGVVAMLGTSFLQHNHGFSAWLNALPVYLRGWAHSSDVSAFKVVAALFVYQPLALGFGLIATVRGWADGKKTPRFLSIWFVSTLMLALLYPGRQVFDLVWALVPLWALAAMEFSHSLGTEKSFHVDRIQAAIIVVLFVVVWLSFLSFLLTGAEAENLWMRWGVMGAAVLLMAIATAIVRTEWSWPVARKGLVVGVSATFGSYLLATMVGVAYLRPADPRELWHPGSGGSQMALLQDSLGELGLLEFGRQDILEVVVLDNSEIMRWGLRKFSSPLFYETISEQERPAFALTPLADTSQSWTESYTGQDFVVEALPAWDDAVDFNWMEWLAFREVPLKQRKVILWARHGSLPGAETEHDKTSGLEEGMIED